MVFSHVREYWHVVEYLHDMDYLYVVVYLRTMEYLHNVESPYWGGRCGCHSFAQKRTKGVVYYVFFQK